MPISDRVLRGGVKTPTNPTDVVVGADAAKELLSLRTEAEKESAVCDERAKSLDEQLAEIRRVAKEKFGTDDLKALQDMAAKAASRVSEVVKDAAAKFDNLAAVHGSWPDAWRTKFAGLRRLLDRWEILVQSLNKA